MPTRRRRLVLSALALAVVAGAVALALRPSPVPAEVARADEGPVRVTVDWIGKTRVRERYRVEAPVTGHLARIELRAGDPVRAGEVVARIGGAAPAPLDPRTRAELGARVESARAAQAEALAGLERTRAAAAQARADAARAEALARGGSLSAQELETARVAERVQAQDLRAMEAGAERAAAQVRAARAALGAGTVAGPNVAVRAPARGAVLRVLRESAGPVAAGTPLLEVGDPASLELVLDLPTADAVRVRPGQRAVVGGWGGAGTLDAVVRRVEPSAYTKVSPLGVEEQRVDVVLDPAGAGWSALGDGFAVDAQVVVEELPDAVRIPASALFRAGDGWAVYVVEGGRARQRAISVAARAGATAAVAGGLRPGEAVIVHPGDEVRDEVRIAPR